MAGKIELMNANGKTLTIEHNDKHNEDNVIDVLQTAYTIETVDEFNTVPKGFKTVIVKDPDRGGVFTWSEDGNEDGGIVFSGSVGYWNRQYEGSVNVKWFGAIGDGKTDDTEAIQKAINSNKSLLFDSIFLVDNIKFNKDYLSYIGVDKLTSGLKLKNNLGKICTITGQLNLFTNLSFIGDNKAVDECLIDINVNYIIQGPKFNSCFFGFINGDSSNNPNAIRQYAIKVNNFNVKDVQFLDCRFKQINNWDKDNIQAGNGFVGGILFINTTEVSDGNLPDTTALINKCEFFNIFTKDIEDIPSHTDADAIRIYQNNINNIVTNNNFIFNDIKFINVQKSGIKIAGVSNISCNNITFDNTYEKPNGYENVIATSVVRLQYASYCEISNIIAKGNINFLLGLNCSDTNVSNIQYIDDNKKYFCNNIINLYDGGYLNNINIHGINASNIEKVVTTTLIGEVDENNFIGNNLSIVNVNCSNITANIINLHLFNNILLDSFNINTTNSGINLYNTSNSNITNIKITNCDTYFIDINANKPISKNHTLSNCVFKASNNNRVFIDRLLNFRNISYSDDRSVGICDITNIIINTPSKSDTGNTEIIIVESNICNISNINVNIIGTDNDSRHESVIKVLNSSGYIGGISINSSGSLNDTCNGINLISCKKIIVNNFSSKYDRGITADSGCDNIDIRNIRCDGTADNIDSDATNVTKSNINSWA